MNDERLIKFVFRTVAALAAAYVLLAGALYFVQEKLVFVPTVLPQDYRFRFAAPFTEVREPSGGVLLHGLHFAAAQPKGALLFFHGNAGALDSWGKIGSRLAQTGYDVYVFDYRGYGKSGGRIRSEADLLADADAMLAHVRRRFADRQIVPIGYSLGSGLAARAAAQIQAQRLLLIAPYERFDELFRQKAGYLVPAFLSKYRMDTAAALARLPHTQITLIHGRSDALIGSEHSRRLAALLGADDVLYETEAEHNDVWAKEDVWRLLAARLE